MICTHYLKIAPFSCGLPHAARALWFGFKRELRSLLASLTQLG